MSNGKARFAIAGMLLALGVLPADAAQRRLSTAPPSQAPASRQIATANNASCDITTSPAATLLVPFFHVDVNKPVNDASNTIFTIVNTVRAPQIARVTIWTDYGHPAIWFNVFLTGYDVQPISMYDLLVYGMIPATSSNSAPGGRSATNSSNPRHLGIDGCASLGGAVPAVTMAAVRRMLTEGRQESDCRVGSSHPNATGYITVDLVNSCSNVSPLDISYYSQVIGFENVLTGDYQHVYPDRSTGNYAGGAPMVHIKAIPEGGTASSATTPLPYTFYDRFTPSSARRIDRRQPLPSSFSARYIQGGTAQFFTDFTFWREGAARAASGCVSANAAMPVASIVRFDDAENPTAVAPGISPSMPMASSMPTTNAMFPPVAGASLTGWMYLNLDNRAATTSAVNPYSAVRPSQNWVIVHMRAEGRYGIDYDASPMANGCTNTAGVTK